MQIYRRATDQLHFSPQINTPEFWVCIPVFKYLCNNPDDSQADIVLKALIWFYLRYIEIIHEHQQKNWTELALLWLQGSNTSVWTELIQDPKLVVLRPCFCNLIPLNKYMCLPSPTLSSRYTTLFVFLNHKQTSATFFTSITGLFDSFSPLSPHSEYLE